MSSKSLKALITVAGVLGGAAWSVASGAGTYVAKGMYVEACSCAPPCACEMIGPNMSCQGVGAFNWTNTTVDGVKLNNVRTAYALGVGSWVEIYIDAPNKATYDAAEKLMRTALNGFGPVQAVKKEKITFTGSGGKYHVTVGDFMDLKTAAIMGGDGKNPLTYSNLHDAIHPTVFQGKVTSGSFKSGDHSFELSDGSNAFYYTKFSATGKLMASK